MLSSQDGRHAVVIGGSIAGLLAAQALTQTFERVTIIERDHFPAGPAFRKGVPQARHVHVLLKRGQMILESLFPGIEAELTAAGVPQVDWIADSQALGARGWLPRFKTNLKGISPSRDLLEWTIRQRLAKNERVTFKEGRDVVGLLPTGSASGVAGVRVRVRPEEGELRTGGEEEMAADFVVDASGRDSRAPEWLAALGYQQAEETVINSFLGYASRYYEAPTDGSVDWKLLIIPRTPPVNKRGGAIYLLEGNRWIVTLSGGGKDYPPTDEQGFLDFARSMPSSAIYDAIKDARPLSPIYGYRRTENRWRHYDRLPRWPEGFIAVGDAVCAFNPVYGQGMSVAALGAELLEQMLRESGGDLTGVSSRFQRGLGKLTATPWQLATGADFRYAETEGGHIDRATRLRWRYGDTVRELAQDHRQIYQTFIEVAHLLKPPSALFKPSIVVQALGRAASRHKTAAVF